MKKIIVLLLISSSVYGQNVKDSLYKDSIETVKFKTKLFKNLNDFIPFLKKTASYEEYMKLTPETTLSTFWNWILYKKDDL